MAGRDSWIGSNNEERARNLQLVVNNSRFLILPWVRVGYLASTILSLCARQLPADWERVCGYRPAFGLLALALACIGLYGVLVQSVGQRQHEIGIHMALGAQAGNVLALVIKEGMLLTGIGLGVGLGAASFCTRLITNQLYGVSPMDPITFVGISLLLGAVTLLACYLPARHATKVDPLIALRSE